MVRPTTRRAAAAILRAGGQSGRPFRPSPAKEQTMKWETPSATEWRFGFEITMYIASR